MSISRPVVLSGVSHRYTFLCIVAKGRCSCASLEPIQVHESSGDMKLRAVAHYKPFGSLHDHSRC